MRYALYGVKLANIYFSVVTRNNVSGFVVGIRIAESNSENKIYENNFMKNAVGLQFPCARYLKV